MAFQRSPSFHLHNFPVPQDLGEGSAHEEKPALFSLLDESVEQPALVLRDRTVPRLALLWVRAYNPNFFPGSSKPAAT